MNRRGERQQSTFKSSLSPSQNTIVYVDSRQQVGRLRGSGVRDAMSLVTPGAQGCNAPLFEYQASGLSANSCLTVVQYTKCSRTCLALFLQASWLDTVKWCHLPTGPLASVMLFAMANTSHPGSTVSSGRVACYPAAQFFQDDHCTRLTLRRWFSD